MLKEIPRAIVMTGSITLLASAAALAQPATHTFRVNNRAMRVWTAGIELRKPGQPVVVLEGGSGSSLDAWQR